MDYLGGSNIVTKVLTCGRRSSESERFDDATLLTLKMEEGATSQGRQAASKNLEEARKKILSLSFYKKCTPANT